MNTQMARTAFAVTAFLALAGCSDSTRVERDNFETQIHKLESQLTDTRKELNATEAALATLKQQNAKQQSERGIGLARTRVIETLSKQLSAEFKDDSGITPGREQFKAVIGGVHVILWGPAANLDAITIIGAFEGDYGTKTGLVLGEILNLATPEWPANERGAWFGKAAARSDNDITVSTLRGDIVVTVVSAKIDQHTIRTISFKRYQN